MSHFTTPRGNERDIRELRKRSRREEETRRKDTHKEEDQGRGLTEEEGGKKERDEGIKTLAG